MNLNTLAAQDLYCLHIRFFHNNLLFFQLLSMETYSLQQASLVRGTGLDVSTSLLNQSLMLSWIMVILAVS